MSFLLFSRKPRTDPKSFIVDARSVGLTEFGLVQLCDASVRVLEQRLGVWHPGVAGIDTEGGEDLETSRRRLPDSGAGAVESCPEDPDICRAAGQHMVRISLPKHRSDRVFQSGLRRSDICLEGRGGSP